MEMEHACAEHNKSESTFFFIEPADAASIAVRFEQELSEELPQMNGLTWAGRICLGPKLLAAYATKQQQQVEFIVRNYTGSSIVLLDSLCANCECIFDSSYIK